MTIVLRKMVSKTFIILVGIISFCLKLYVFFECNQFHSIDGNQIKHKVISEFTFAVKVNLQGQITLGKDIMDTITFIIDQNAMNSRRSISMDEKKNGIMTMVTSKEICAELKFCTPSLRHFLEDYIVLLINGIESVFNASSAKDMFTHSHRKVEKILEDVKRALKKIDGKINEEKEFYYWNGIIKKISAKFQSLVLTVTDQQFKKTDKERKSLIQKLITAIVVIEHKYENILCREHKICIQSYEYTKTLHNFLRKLTNLHEEKIRHFLKHFYEALFKSTFYSQLSEVTALQFQNILKDMSHSNNVPTRGLLQSIDKAVETRLDLIKNKKDTRLSYDVLLMHTILSDLDHCYSVKKERPLKDYAKNFNDWIINDHLGRHIREAIEEIGNIMSAQSNDIYQKAKNEVQVFLELTVDPEK